MSFGTHKPTVGLPLLLASRAGEKKTKDAQAIAAGSPVQLSHLGGSTYHSRGLAPAFCVGKANKLAGIPDQELS